MNKEQIWQTLNNLAQSQGFYGRLVHDIEQSGRKDEILTQLEKQNFKEPVDLVLFIEC